MSGFAWVTLATNDSYSLGALVLAHSLRRVGTRHDLAVLITPGVTDSMREKLASVFTLVKEVNVLDSKDEANLAVLQRPELGVTFTKLHCWRLTQYEKCVFIDADALVVRNCDELFEREELSAAPDVGWPDCFNSGVFVYRPSQQTFASITSFAASQGSFDGADQGLLNMYFSDWAHKDISKHLPFIYNMCSTATYSYAPAFKQYGENVRIVHFIGATKPWLQYFDTLTGIVQPPPSCGHLQPLLQIWWNIFCDSVHPQLSDAMVASNLTTIWHDSISFLTNPITYNNTSLFYDPEQDAYSDIHSGPPDFSEFKDPWEHYSASADSFLQNNSQSRDNDKQYYCDTNLNDTESRQLISHNQCGAEPPPMLSSYNQTDDYVQSHNSSHYYQSSHSLQYENCTYESQVNEEYNYEHNQAHDEQQSIMYESEIDLNCLSENLSEIAAFCDFIEQFHDESNDHNHHTDHESIHIDEHTHNDNQNCQSNGDISEPSTSATVSLHDSRQDYSETNNHEQTQTDTHIPNSSDISEPCTDPNNVATQSEMSTSPCIENAEGGLAGALSKLTMGESRTAEQQAIEDHMRKQNWEQGHIDFMGRDSFDNILKKINETLATAPAREPSPIKETRQPEKSSGKSSEVETALEEREAALPGTLKSKKAKSEKVVDKKGVNEQKSSK